MKIPFARSQPFCIVATLAAALTVHGQLLTTLHTFTGGSDGAVPKTALAFGGNNQLFGTTYGGGTNGYGTVFALNTDGTGYTELHSFISPGSPETGVFVSGNTLYGTTQNSVFSINTDGSGFSFLTGLTAYNEGLDPAGSLIQVNGALWFVISGNKTTIPPYGGIFDAHTTGGGYAYHLFLGIDITTPIMIDGAFPMGGMVLIGAYLYGTTSGGACSTYSGEPSGTFFQVSTNETGTRSYQNFPSFPTLGERPEGDLMVASNGLIYGTCASGSGSPLGPSTSFGGTVWECDTNGNGAVIHTFLGSDGATPFGGLVSPDGYTLYGTTGYGGAFNKGTVYTINTDGTGFTTLYSFTGGSDGAVPMGDLILSNNVLYGTTSAGGSGGRGTVFALNLSAAPAVTVNIAPAGGQSVVFWPVSYAGYVLQATTNLASSNWFNVGNSMPVTGVTVSNQMPSLFFRLQGP
ncbi:MAG TPA: choice-of-anchor tandem repeat GloVer-containing protein [Alphaproteobacteria bacterium]|nr:choice-of-anchor tandem repeat GloVer-containing protein [Alphaproteobacteria bacterium]